MPLSSQLQGALNVTNLQCHLQSPTQPSPSSMNQERFNPRFCGKLNGRVGGGGLGPEVPQALATTHNSTLQQWYLTQPLKSPTLTLKFCGWAALLESSGWCATAVTIKTEIRKPKTIYGNNIVHARSFFVSSLILLLLLYSVVRCTAVKIVKCVHPALWVGGFLRNQKDRSESRFLRQLWLDVSACLDFTKKRYNSNLQLTGETSKTPQYRRIDSSPTRILRSCCRHTQKLPFLPYDIQ